MAPICNRRRVDWSKQVHWSNQSTLSESNHGIQLLLLYRSWVPWRRAAPCIRRPARWPPAMRNRCLCAAPGRGASAGDGTSCACCIPPELRDCRLLLRAAAAAPLGRIPAASGPPAPLEPQSGSRWAASVQAPAWIAPGWPGWAMYRPFPPGLAFVPSALQDPHRRPELPDHDSVWILGRSSCSCPARLAQTA